MWEGLREKLAEGYGAFVSGDSNGDDTEWNPQTERRLKLLLRHLKTLKTYEDTKQSQQNIEALSKQIAEVLKELLPTLRHPGYTYPKGSQALFSTVRKYFLDVWHLLLRDIDILFHIYQKFAFEAIMQIITRKEFDLSHLALRDGRPGCAKEDLVIMHRYRVLLFNTQAFVNVKLSELTDASLSISYPFTQFCARVLSINFFRLPGIGQAIINAVALSPPQLEEFREKLRLDGFIFPQPSTDTKNEQEKYLDMEKREEDSIDTANGNSNEGGEGEKEVTNEEKEKEGDTNKGEKEKEQGNDDNWEKGEEKQEVGNHNNNNNNHNVYNDGPSRREAKPPRGPHAFVSYLLNDGNPPAKGGGSVLSKYPELARWHQFHSALLQWRGDNEDEKLKLSPTEWLKTLAERDKLFLLFVKDWISHITSIAAHPISAEEWGNVKGYAQFLSAFMYELKKRAQLTKPLLDCSVAFLSTDPTLITPYVRFIFAKTNVYDTFAVTDALTKLEAWLDEFRLQELALPADFDIEFLVTAFHIIFTTEHHQLLLKTLILLYKYSDVFTGDLRMSLFGDFLLKDCFYKLFLHWDINVRNTYHQLLIYKMVRLKRSLLHVRGYNVSELGRKTYQKGGVIAHASQLVEKEEMVDLALYDMLEGYLTSLQEQLRKTTKNELYPAHLEVYVPTALSEYKRYLSFYFKWESDGAKDVPKLIPLMFLDQADAPPSPSLQGKGREK